MILFGDDVDDRSGRAVAAGDINGDGFDDIIIGAYNADGSGNGTACGAGQVGDRCDAGETYVIFGNPQGVGGIAELAGVDPALLEASDSSSPSPGVLAGIVAGAVTAVVAGVGAALWAWRRRLG